MLRPIVLLLVLFATPSAPLAAQGDSLRLDSLLGLPDDTAKWGRVLRLATDVIPERPALGLRGARAGLAATARRAELRALRPGYDLLLGDYQLYDRRDLDSAGFHYDRALATARELGLPRAVADATFKQAHLATNARDAERATELGQRAATLYAEIGEDLLAAEARMFLAFPQVRQGNHGRALAYLRAALPAFRAAGNDFLVAVAAREAAIALFHLDSLDRAAPLADEAVAAARRSGNESRLAFNLLARADVLTQLRRYAEAEADFTEIDRLRSGKTTPNEDKLRAHLYQRTGRRAEAGRLLRRAEARLRAGGSGQNRLRRYEFLSSLYYIRAANEVLPGRYDTFDHYRQLRKLYADSANLVVRNRELAELDEKYRNRENRLLIDQQDARLRNRRLQVFGLLGLTALALAAGAVFFVLSRRLRRRNAENERLVGEKEVLIGEIHHRVKNNLQVISSLLHIQGRSLGPGDDGARAALRESQARVQAMGMIHQRLYRGTEATTLPMPDYLAELGDTLLDTFGMEERVDLFYDVEDITLDVDTAIPLGLITNELLTNALKYAFPGGREGTVELALHRTEDGLVLSVADDGVGAGPAGPPSAGGTGFGGGLVELLSRQLGGRLSVDRAGPGYRTTLHFSAAAAQV